MASTLVRPHSGTQCADAPLSNVVMPRFLFSSPAAWVLLLGGMVWLAGCDTFEAADREPAPPPDGAMHRLELQGTPDRVLLYDAEGAWVATFTVGARTVTLAGPIRTFAEPAAEDDVTHGTWVRLLPRPFDGTIDEAWLRAARRTDVPDLLATAMEYLGGAPDQHDAAGLRFAGDADYGPLQADGSRQEGADFNDYLGLAWTYADGVDRPEPHQRGSLDCSGFVRMVFGYRHGHPLARTPDGYGLPRRAVQQQAGAPGVILHPDAGTQLTDFSRLAPGDLVFFDVATDDGDAIDHVGIYLGRDAAGHPRFVSSRKTINGPTMGDVGGRSRLDGAGLYARNFRAAHRL